MVKKLLSIVLFNSILISVHAQKITQNDSLYWPSWRGPFATGQAVNANPPIHWSETENLRWKTDIPGRGLSSPIVWKDQIILTAAIPLDEVADEDRIAAQKDGRPFWMKLMCWSKTTENVQQFVVYSISRSNGAILWRTPVREDLPHEGIHKDGSWASNSCVTEGEHIIASFGSAGIYCLDMAGTVIWQVDLGDMEILNTFGEGSSPAIYDDKVVVAWDDEADSFITALDIETGELLWRQSRMEKTNWSTPIIVEVSGHPQIIRAGANRCVAYDLVTGKEIWSSFGVSKSACPSPVSAEGVVYLAGSFKGGNIHAVKLEGAEGKVDSSANLLWTHDQETPYIPSPLYHEGKLYFLKDYKASLTCLDAESGKVYYTKQKLEGMRGVYASPVSAEGRIYIAGRNGVTYVIKAGSVFEVLAVNQLDDVIDASPAIVGDDLIIRGIKSLYLLSKK